MSQPPCEQIEAMIQKITEDLQSIDEQLHDLEVKGMNELKPGAYVELQKQVDHLTRKRRSLQDAWDQAMTDLAICRSQSSSQDPRPNQS